MKRTIKGLWIALAFSVLAFIAVYILLGFYYKDGFPCFTWINGVYCAGKSVDEVNDELCSKYTYGGINVIDATGAELFISREDVNLTIDFTDSLNYYLKDKNSFAWGLYFFNNLVTNVSPTVTLDENALIKKISDWEIFVPTEDLEVYIVKSSESGYLLHDDLDQVPIMENIVNAVGNAIISFNSEIRLVNNTDCYHSISYNQEQQHIRDLYEKIDKLQNCEIQFSIADDIVGVDRNSISEWIVTESDIENLQEETVSKKITGSGYVIVSGEEKKVSDIEEISADNGFAIDENGNILLSEKKMYEYMKSLSAKYGTSGMLDRYREGIDDIVIINDTSKGDGSIYDIDSEYEFLKNAYLDGTYDASTVRKWVMSDSAVTYNAAEELGNTYIEINMGQQMLYYYAEGELIMDMPVVTGNVNRSRGTPTGIYPVYNKRYHTNLIGVDYVSYVNYWLGVNKGVGIHDATWRSKFGEEIYKRDGSHGCINCPLDSVSELWEIVEIGTPVILYY